LPFIITFAVGLLYDTRDDAKKGTYLFSKYLVVHRAGFEPAEPIGSSNFRRLMGKPLGYVLTISFDLGCRCIVSTHLSTNWLNLVRHYYHL